MCVCSFAVLILNTKVAEDVAAEAELPYLFTPFASIMHFMSAASRIREAPPLRSARGEAPSARGEAPDDMPRHPAQLVQLSFLRWVCIYRIETCWPNRF